MDAIQGAVPARAGSANVNPRPIAHRQFKLLPVAVRGMPRWNARIEKWAAARG